MPQIAREGGEELVANVDIVKNPYNYAHELDRKRQLALAWARGTGMENPEDARVLEVHPCPLSAPVWRLLKMYPVLTCLSSWAGAGGKFN